MVFIRHRAYSTGKYSAVRILTMSITISSYLLLSFISFIKHLTGIVLKPYQTYRELTKGVFALEAAFITFLVIGYIGTSSLLRKGLDVGPLFLSLYAGKVFWGILFTFVFAWGSLYFAGKLLGGQGTPKSLFLPWAYSLIPTTIWFLLTSFFYFILPPPRTQAITGKLFTIVFITLSLGLFYWKGMLYYFTLRLGHKLSLSKILIVSFIVFPLGILYSLITYKLGLFRIPFI